MTNITAKVFTDIRKVSKSGHEYWSARELGKVLDYLNFRNFEPVISKAKQACRNSGLDVSRNFIDILGGAVVGSGVLRGVSDVALSRYACYLIMQNADPSKEVVALGQTYFAVQTRKQEVHMQALEDQKRVNYRADISVRNKHLAQTASKAGVKNYGTFTNAGYRGLYGELTEQDIHELKKLDKNQKILDHMGSEELADNIFRVAQTDAKIEREGLEGEAKASQAHYEVGKKVRKIIKELDATLPENLPKVDHVKNANKRFDKPDAQLLS